MEEENIPEENVSDDAAGDIPENLPPLFGKYEVSNIVIGDKGLARYMNLDTRKLHQHARHKPPVQEGKSLDNRASDK